MFIVGINAQGGGGGDHHHHHAEEYIDYQVRYIYFILEEQFKTIIFIIVPSSLPLQLCRA